MEVTEYKRNNERLPIINNFKAFAISRGYVGTFAGNDITLRLQIES